MSQDDKLKALQDVNEIKLTDSEKATVKGIFDSMKSAEKALEAIETEEVEPMVYVAPRFNVFRDDVRVQNFDRGALLKGAPDKNEDSWIVPKVVK